MHGSASRADGASTLEAHSPLRPAHSIANPAGNLVGANRNLQIETVAFCHVPSSWSSHSATVTEMLPGRTATPKAISGGNEKGPPHRHGLARALPHWLL